MSSARTKLLQDLHQAGKNWQINLSIIFSRRFGARKQVGAHSDYGGCRAVRGFYCKLGVGALLGGEEGPMSKWSKSMILIGGHGNRKAEFWREKKTTFKNDEFLE